MKTILRRLDHVALYGLRGDLDATIAQPFLAEVDRALDRGAKILVIDGSRIEFMTSMGLSALVEARRRCRERGGELAIARPSVAVRQILDLLELHHQLPTFASDATACASVA